MGSIDDPAGGARRRRIPMRRWLAGGLMLASVTLGFVALGPSAFAATPKWLTVSTGDNHTCAIKVDTTLWCWGANHEGQLGVAGIAGSAIPVEVGGEGWSVVSAGTHYTCGIRNGRRYCWGENNYGQLGLRDTRNRATPVAGPGESNNWLTISAGAIHTCGLRTSGLAQCWGYNHVGQLGIDSSVTLRNRPTTVAGDITWSAISVGANFTCGLDVGGRRYCWGGNLNGELGLGLDTQVKRYAPDYLPGDRRYSSIDLGHQSACAVTTSGRLACWGWNGYYILGLGDIDARTAPVILPETNWRSVSVASHHTCGVRTRLTTMTDQRYCWGRNAFGKIGDGTTTDRKTPSLIDDGRWSMVSTGRRHTCGISSGQYLYCWGDNYHGQLGVGQDVVSDHILEPVLVR